MSLLLFMQVLGMVGPDKFVMPVGLDHAISGLMDQVTLHFQPLCCTSGGELEIVQSSAVFTVFLFMLLGAEVLWDVSW